jgi:mono/diheme cytochrome c family protein
VCTAAGEAIEEGTMSVTVLLVAALSVAAQAERSDPFAPTGAVGGRIIFRTICATCHGRNARGSGPIADALKVPPADLTRIAERRGGTFPADWVAARIDGRDYIEVHGPSEMPVWGEGLAYAVADRELREARIERAIAMLVEYLATIQRSEAPPGSGS